MKADETTYGGTLRLWRPSKGGSTGFWHGNNYSMAAVRTFKPPWRSATRFPALVCAPGPGGGKVMTADETTYGGTLRLWRPSKGGSTGSWHGNNYTMAAVRTVKPPWRSATRFPALVCAPGPGVGKVMKADETTYGGTWRLWRPSKGVSTGSWHGTNYLMAVVRTVKPPWRSATRFPALVCAPGPGVRSGLGRGRLDTHALPRFGVRCWNFLNGLYDLKGLIV